MPPLLLVAHPFANSLPSALETLARLQQDGEVALRGRGVCGGRVGAGQQARLGSRHAYSPDPPLHTPRQLSSCCPPYCLPAGLHGRVVYLGSGAQQDEGWATLQRALQVGGRQDTHSG